MEWNEIEWEYYIMNEYMDVVLDFLVVSFSSSSF